MPQSCTGARVLLEEPLKHMAVYKRLEAETKQKSGTGRTVGGRFYGAVCFETNMEVGQECLPRFEERSWILFLDS